jgi:hypothetical protein
VFLRIQNAFCRGDACTARGAPAEVDKGLRLVFGLCAVLAAVGIAWTWFLVDVSGSISRRCRVG